MFFSIKMQSSQYILFAFMYSLSLVYSTKVLSNFDILLDVHESVVATPKSLVKADLYPQQQASEVGTRVLKHLKSIKIAKNSDQVSGHLPSFKTAESEQLHPRVLSSPSKTAEAKAASAVTVPIDAKLAEDSVLQLPSVQVGCLVFVENFASHNSTF